MAEEDPPGSIPPERGGGGVGAVDRAIARLKAQRHLPRRAPLSRRQAVQEQRKAVADIQAVSAAVRTLLGNCHRKARPQGAQEFWTA